MSSYLGTVSVRADAKAVFDFVSKPENLEHYVPHVTRCDFGAGDVVHLEGECPNGSYRGVAGLIVDRDELWMRWESRANLNYRGWLHVKPTESGSEVTLHLDFGPGLDAPLNGTFDHLLRHHPGTIQDMIDETLGRIKGYCEVAVGLPIGLI